jgi:histidinol-phosphate aminotransferase
MIIKPRPVLGTFTSYSTEEADLPIKLDANECAEDLPQEVKDEIIKRFEKLPFNRYPEISAGALRQKIGAEFGLSSENVLLGNGSSQLLQALCFTFADRERSVVYHHPTFSMYNIYARLADSQGVGAETKQGFLVDPDKILKVAEETNAGIIILCNPNNPTGTTIPQKDIEYILKNSSCPVVADEAYYEFYGVSSINLLKKYPHLIIARTFSKAYALASSRVGYVISSDEVLRNAAKTIMPYNLNALSLCAAETVLSMKEYFAERIAGIVSMRQEMSSSLAEIPGIEVFPSDTNFVLIKIASPERGINLTKYLLTHGISVRNFSNAPSLSGCLRITTGTKTENEKCLSVIKSFKE